MDGRRLYEQSRRLLKAKRCMESRGITPAPVKPGVVLQFPKKKEVTDGENQDD